MLRSKTKGKLVGWVYVPESERWYALAAFECASCGEPAGEGRVRAGVGCWRCHGREASK